MIVLQRGIALLMAAAMVFLFLMPLALARHNYALTAALVVLFACYAGLNIWLLVRSRTTRRRT